MEKSRFIMCKRCFMKIDPQVCWCGDYIDQHYPMIDGHNPIPMGCVCGYADFKDDNLFEKIANWSVAMWPTQQSGSIIKHIQKEISELEESPKDGEEMADIIILLCRVARNAGVDLMDEVERKFKIVQTRTWQAPDENGIIEHVRG
jgi:NTP pyrophosphatase (non-canonical NTP hydrolase)